MYEVMIIDDDAGLLEMVSVILRRDNYHVVTAYSAKHAMSLMAHSSPDLFVLDAMMPEMDGLALCRYLRNHEDTAQTPILFLTGMADSFGVVEALLSGGDDYLRKPFQPRELSARVRALLRRSSVYSEHVPSIRIIPSRYQVFIGVREVMLTRVEYELLCFMAAAPYQLFSTEDLLLKVWQYPAGVGDAALVRNHIRNLRRKIEIDPERPLIVQSRHGRGYMVRARIETASDDAPVV